MATLQPENGTAKRPPDSESRIRSKRVTVCLVTPLAVADFIDPDLTANARNNSALNLGILTLAASLRERGYRPHVVNLDQVFLDFLQRSGRESTADFFPFAMEHLEPLSFDVFGFSSICSSYPLTLRLANALKRLNPDSRMILGGPQASVTDVSTLQAFPSIDFVIRGEADETLPRLLDVLASQDCDAALNALAGITFRRGGEVVRYANAPVIADLDRLPFPAFDLDPELAKRGHTHLEIGRGCPFACTFCSTNDFFRRSFRLKSPAKMLEHMKRVKEEYGVTHFSLVHDMYTIDRRQVLAFCDALVASGEKFTWGCSARTDCIDDELIESMARAGCRGIFFGIETGSDRLQRVINKKLDLVEARKRIRCADRHGIETAVALITGFPEETRDDVKDTIHFFVDSLRLEHAEPQLSLLAPLAATPIHSQYKDQLVFDHIFSDMSYQSWRQDKADVEMIGSYPDIFPNFYAVPTAWVDRSYLKEIRDFVTSLTTWFCWLPVGLRQDSGDFLEMFDRWRTWSREERTRSSTWKDGIAPYYSHREFRDDFLEFVRDCYLTEMATARAAIATLVEVEAWSESCVGHVPARATEEGERLDAGCVPFRRPDLRLMELNVDYKELVDALRSGADLTSVPARHVVVIFSTMHDRQVQVRQLAPLSASLLRLCDGKRTVEEIVQEFATLGASVDGVSAEKVCLFGLMLLREEGIIGVSSEFASGSDGALACGVEADAIDRA